MHIFEEQDKYVRHLEVEHAVAIGVFSAVIALVLLLGSLV